MRIALCQINTTIGAFSDNVERVSAFLAKAAEHEAELVIFPELVLSSYPPLDLLERQDFLAKNQEALLTLKSKLHSSQTVVLGSIASSEKTSGRDLVNAAVVFHKGEKVFQQAKRLLPTYDVFDEGRYFEPAESSMAWESSWGKIGFSVCEDAWFSDVYKTDPALDLKGCDFIVNISASPFEMDKQKKRHEMLCEFAQKASAPLIYVNCVGGNDEILFEGVSQIWSQSGKLLFELPAFREGMSVVDFHTKDGGAVTEVASYSFLCTALGAQDAHWDKMFTSKRVSDESDIERIHRGLVLGIRDYFRKTGFKKAVVGLSGGIDSAVVASLAAEALGPRNVLGVSIPSQYSSSHSLTDAEGLAKKIGIEYRVHSLKFINTTLLMELKESFGSAPADFTEENIQSRLRGVVLMALANKRGALLLTTGNKSELAVGYCTIYGDMAGALGPLGDLYKTKVYELARWINTKMGGWIPESTLSKPPSAELKPNQTDQDTLPPYEILDRILKKQIEGQMGIEDIVLSGEDQATTQKVFSMIKQSEFKRRQAAPVLKVTPKAFGLGRRVPIAKAFL